MSICTKTHKSSVYLWCRSLRAFKAYFMHILTHFSHSMDKKTESNLQILHEMQKLFHSACSVVRSWEAAAFSASVWLCLLLYAKQLLATNRCNWLKIFCFSTLASDLMKLCGESRQRSKVMYKYGKLNLRFWHMSMSDPIFTYCWALCASCVTSYYVFHISSFDYLP